MSSEKVNLNPALNQKALAEFQRTFRQTGTAAADKAENLTTNNASEKSVAVRETFEESPDVQRLEEIKALVEAARVQLDKTPDYDAKKLEEIRERVINGDYDTPKIRVEVSKSLARVMKLLDVFVD